MVSCGLGAMPFDRLRGLVSDCQKVRGKKHRERSVELIAFKMIVFGVCYLKVPFCCVRTVLPQSLS